LNAKLDVRLKMLPDAALTELFDFREGTADAGLSIKKVTSLRYAIASTLGLPISSVSCG